MIRHSKNTAKELFLLFGLLILGSLAFSFNLFFLLGDNPDTELSGGLQNIFANASQVEFLLLIMLMHVLSFLLPAILYIQWRRFPIRRLFDVKAFSLLWIMPLLWICSLPIIGLLFELNSSIPLPESLTQSEIEAQGLIDKMATSDNIWKILLSVFVIGVIPAIGEELIFRGLLQSLLQRLWRSPWVAISISAFIFAIFHGYINGFLPIFILGWLLGFLFAFSGSLWPGILFHFINNAAKVIILNTSPDLENMNQSDSVLLQLYIPACIGLVFLLWYFKKQAISARSQKSSYVT